MEQHPDARRRLSRPVISVGNLSVGGTGKTPVVAALAHWLIACGERPSILSRGYKRQRPADGVTVVSDGARVLAGVEAAGDEPLMLARQVPGAVVCVGADRHLCGVLAEGHLACTVHLLDDGFQHLALWRDLDVLVTRLGEIPTGRVLPAGRLREPMAAAARADLLIVADATGAAAKAEAWTLGISQAAGMIRTLGHERWVSGGAAAGVPGGPVVAVAGIAHPEQFFTELRGSGRNLAAARPLADHHVYTVRDLQAIADLLTNAGARAVLTTEKDAVKLEALAPLPFPLAAIPLEVSFDASADVHAAVTAALQRARGVA